MKSSALINSAPLLPNDRRSRGAGIVDVSLRSEKGRGGGGGDSRSILMTTGGSIGSFTG